eukprot:TRINITY_DN13647_c0_g1_i2.p2 TRINITY_DN13647_c0_g1~~TRINITY_DN13647_c0_g1_i2.p2  ORF type:complete len:193 (-),score=8.13 TRINITY_DN13647_c0_g1_i2:101-679(-)
MYINFQKLVHKAISEDNYKPQLGDQHAADICSKARLRRFMYGGLLFGGGLFLCSYTINWPKSVALKALICFPMAYFGGRFSMYHADQDCVLAVINQNTPLAREMENFLRKTHPGYPALNDMKDFSHIQDRQPSISWLKANDPVRLKDFQFSEDDLEENQKKKIAIRIIERIVWAFLQKTVWGDVGRRNTIRY